MIYANMKTKKELKAVYKQIQPIAGVFQIKNTETGMILPDAATNVSAKWNRHRSELKFGSHRNTKLQKDWKELGEDCFIFSIMSELIIKEDVGFDLEGEVKLLRELVEEEMDISVEMKY